MALPGHADDCAACSYHELPDEDRDVLDASAFTGHVRQEPPARPQATTPWTVTPLWVGVTVALGGFLTGAWPVGLIGLAIFLPSFFMMRSQQADQYESWQTWQASLADWRAEQTAEWLRQRANHSVWPCPVCGSLSCPNQHSETRTATVRVGPFYRSQSYTDPI